jgi:hydantoinase/carbamoylase family amidase
VSGARLPVRGERLARDLAALGEIGRDPAGGMTRLALGESDAAARALVRREMEAIGLAVAHDEVGNLFGRRPGSDEGAAIVMTGSHLDTVPRGGRYDGPLGVAGAVEAMRAIVEAGVKTRRSIEIAIFVGEEGSRFGRGTIGSAAVAGDVPIADILALRDAAGVSFAEALATYGDRGAPRPARRERGSLHAFVELHIEQGGVLEANGVPIGAPTAINGLVQQVIRFVGDANHAGATPMNLRRDALAGAAELILAVEKLAVLVGGGAVATVGKAEVEPGAFNIIPGAVTIATDLRAPRPELLDALTDGVREAAERIARDRRLGVDVRRRQRVEPGPLDERVISAVERGAAACGLRSHRMLSGAIHDALHMANVCPSGMIFVPSKGGKSHCPEEETALDDMLRGCAVLASTLVDLAG